MSKTIHVKLAVEVPRVPNYLITEGKPVLLCALSEEGLCELAEQWKQKLLARARQQLKEQSWTN